MAASDGPVEPVPGNYPNHLASPAPERTRLPPAAALLAGLVLLCLVLRLLMALRIPGACPDGVFYIHLAKALEAGDLDGGFQEMSVNTFPAILVLLHRAGLEWETAGMLWGVAISSLVVLPLFGWLRRQFDDRVALVACLLYAVHPRLIAWSPETLRDPTFWFLFVLSIYLIWRAISEVRMGLSALAGLAVCLACLTRFEGLFLYVPLGLWAFWRWKALRVGRWRLVLGATACAAVLPGLLLLANLAWRYWSGDWVLPRLGPLVRVQTWLGALWGAAPAQAAPAQAAPATHPAALPPPMAPSGPPPSLVRTLWVFFPMMTRGLSPAFALLMLGGLWGWRRLWARRDHQALFYVALLVMAGIWVQYWYDRLLCPRYALSIALMASPFAALGLLGLSAWLVRLAGRWHFGARLRAAIAAAPLAVVAALGVGDAMTCNESYFSLRTRAALLGNWLRDRGASPRMLVGPAGITQIVGYYAQGQDCQSFRLDNEDPLVVVAMVESLQPDVLLLHPTRGMPKNRCESLVETLKPLGLERVDPVGASEGWEPLFVLLRGAAVSRVARRAFSEP